MKKLCNVRNNSGAFASLAFIALLPIMGAIGAFAVDCMHFDSTKGELQKAVDAAALAGASKLYQYLEAGGPAIATQTAETIARLNSSDGRPVDGALADCDVTVTFPVVPTVNELTGQCKVVASMQIKSIWAHVIGSAGQTVTCTALAGLSHASDTALAGALFPLLISLTEPGPDGVALKTLTVGQQIKADWKSNLAWTAFKTHNANDVRDQMLNYRKPGPLSSPKVKLGSDIDMTNGVQATNINALKTSWIGKVIVMPVINGKIQGSSDKPVVGFVAFRIDSMGAGADDDDKKTITGTIVKADLYGTGPEPVYTAGSDAETFFKNNDMLPKPVRLLN